METEQVLDKKSMVTDRLYKRESERQADVQKKREEKEATISLKENANYFTENFTKEKEGIERDVLACDSSTDKNELTSKFDSFSQRLTKLQKFVTESTLFLPAYDLNKAQEALSKLQSFIQEKREQFIPKKKFAFRSKKKEVEKAKEEKKEAIENEPKKLEVELYDCKFADVENDILEKKAEEIYQKDVMLTRLTNCTIKLYGAPSTVHMNKLTNCRILCGPVSSSIFITDCQKCVFVLACQQLRTHTTTDSGFYLHVTSRAIIEDCNTIEFAPYNLSYPTLNEHFTAAGLDRSKNNWNDVDDFNWLASDVKSPNWSIMPENKRIQSW